jgi:hypothetical protein
MSWMPCLVRDGFAPFGGIGMCDVLRGSLAGIPCSIKLTSCVSVDFATSLLVCRSAPRCGTPCPFIP